MDARVLSLLTTIIVTVLLMTAACSSADNTLPVTLETSEATSTPTDPWSTLLQRTPYPYTTPLPPAYTTAVDGTYTKFDPREGTRPFCVRCMPYPAEGGIWMLQLKQGIFRIFSTRSLNGWRSLGSFTVSEDRIMLFNDPHCLETVGVYTWKLEAEQLTMEAIVDECADGWRAITFTNYSWVLETPSG